MSADTNNRSRAVSIINDETQRGWHLSMTELERQYLQDEDIIQEVKLLFQMPQKTSKNNFYSSVTTMMVKKIEYVVIQWTYDTTKVK